MLTLSRGCGTGSYTTSASTATIFSNVIVTPTSVESPVPALAYSLTAAPDLALAMPPSQVDIITPEEYMGDVIGDINSRRGSIVELSDRMGMKSVESLVPLANMFQVRNPCVSPAPRLLLQGFVEAGYLSAAPSPMPVEHLFLLKKEKNQFP